MMTKHLSEHKKAIAAATALLSSIALPAQAATPSSALVMAWNIDAISTFDPAQVGEVVTNELLQNTCDSLVDFDPNDESKVVPLLAKSWDVSEDRKQITFHLNEGMKFPTGEAASAKELAWSMQRVIKLGRLRRPLQARTVECRRVHRSAGQRRLLW